MRIDMKHIKTWVSGAVVATCGLLQPIHPIMGQTLHTVAINSSQQAQTQGKSDLDADGNGLYDDTERKALLDVFVKVCPDFQGPFDTDGDGKVTILEQTQGRHPLTFLVADGVLKSRVQIPWGIDVFPEWIMTAYLQEDVSPGSVALQPTRGTIDKPASQDNDQLIPRKASNGSGVEFAANSGHFLTMTGERDARWNYRWCLMTFRINARSGKDQQTVLLDLNSGNRSNMSSPKIWFNKSTGLNIQYVGYNKGLDKRVMSTKAVIADGKTWNVLVCGIRYGQMYASVNGVELESQKPQLPRFSGEWLQGKFTSQIGDTSGGNMSWAYDAVVFGQTEPTEAMVRKLTGWAAHRLGFTQNLPKDHPYKTSRPIVDAEDFPYRYLHDDEKWMAWGQSLKKDVTRVNAGGERFEPHGFERVFYDDFRADRVKASTSGEGDLWVGPGFNIAVGMDAQLVAPGNKPDVYTYDANNKLQTLSLVKQGNRWRGSAFYSVNDLGHGYTWKGAKIFRLRCMFPNVEQENLGGGLFPAFWSYDPDFLFWRTANRIEVDWFEFDGKSASWYNGIASHVHYCHVNNIFAKNPKRYKSFKVYSGLLNEEKGKIPGGLKFWDGEYHTWEFIVEDEMTYVNVTIKDQSGREKWVEVCRSPTAPIYLENLDLQFDYALKANQGLPKDDQRQDFTVDWVEVLQKTTDIQKLPQQFSARPRLTGDHRVGGTITCQANVKDATDVRYFWYADGYPLTYGPSNTWQVTPDEKGKELRCRVMVVGALNRPEAWSMPTKIR